ncbi:hypothetical protein GBA52_009697 [Prunus armeniaca]|nr:hypothetical protein GBA52_009697 [Prunus armeniaca]
MGVVRKRTGCNSIRIETSQLQPRLSCLRCPHCPPLLAPHSRPSLSPDELLISPNSPFSFAPLFCLPRKCWKATAFLSVFGLFFWVLRNLGF